MNGICPQHELLTGEAWLVFRARASFRIFGIAFPTGFSLVHVGNWSAG